MQAVRFNLSLPDKDAVALKELAATRGITVTAAIRQAIATEHFLDNARREGRKVLVESDDGLREIVFVR